MKIKLINNVLIVLVVALAINCILLKETNDIDAITGDLDSFQALSADEFTVNEKVIAFNSVEKTENDFLYIEEIPMPINHQEFLFNKSKQLGLDYEKLLAVIATESNFNPTIVSSTNDYGYFQINLINHKDFASKYETENNPLSPQINLLWGSHMLKDLYDYWSEQGVVGKELDYYVWSSYNKGLNGFKKYGYANFYISKIEKNLSEIENLFQKVGNANEI